MGTAMGLIANSKIKDKKLKHRPIKHRGDAAGLDLRQVYWLGARCEMKQIEGFFS